MYILLIALVLVLVLWFFLWSIPARKKRYLLVKGWCGFGDRLQCLSHAIEYARKTNRTIVVDWTDEIWGGDQKVNFDTFCKIVGIPTASCEELYAKKDLTVWPAVWNGQLDKTPGLYMYETAYQIDLQSFPIRDEDIVVYTSTEVRTYQNENLCKNFRIRYPYRTIVLDAIDKHKDYTTVVHLRGSDRVPPEKQDEYLETNIFSKLTESDNKILIVGDDQDLIKKFKQKYPDATVRTPEKHTSSSSEELKNPVHQRGNVDKIDFNTETLIDFFLIMHAKKVVNDPNSIFSNLALFIRQNGGYPDILGP
jgi:hypothetical protein